MSSPYSSQITPEYSRPERRNANRRKKFQDSNSPLKIRPFEDLGELMPLGRELASRIEEQRKAEIEKKMRQEILKKIKNMDQENWLFNCGGDKFFWNYKLG
jgi:hypothetical protein